MKMTMVLRGLVIVVLSIALPVSQVYAVVPKGDSVFHDLVESVGEETVVEIQAPGLEENVETGALSEDLLQSEALIPNEILSEEASDIEEIGETADETLALPDQDRHFWTNRKIAVTASVLLTTGLIVGLLLLLAAGGGGGSSGSGAGAAGGGALSEFIPPVGGGGDGEGLIPPPGGSLPPGSGIPHHPEPSTFLLLGLGLLVPLLRKRGV